jgi:hypothetical protein
MPTRRFARQGPVEPTLAAVRPQRHHPPAPRRRQRKNPAAGGSLSRFSLQAEGIWLSWATAQETFHRRCVMTKLVAILAVGLLLGADDKQADAK